MPITINISISGENVDELKQELKKLVTQISFAEEQTKVEEKTGVKKKGGRKKSICLTHDQVFDLVFEYDEIVRRDGLRGAAVIKALKKKFNLTCSEWTIERAVFHHKEIPGYEDIPVPLKQSARPATNNLEVRKAVEEIKYLRDSKSLPLATIVSLVHDDPKWVRRVYDNYVYSDICVTRENALAFDEKYKGFR